MINCPIQNGVIFAYNPCTSSSAAASAKSLQLCPTLCNPIDPTMLLCPWDSPGKNTGVGRHFLLQCVKMKSESEVTQSFLTLSDPMVCSLPVSSVHGIFQSRVVEWGATAFPVHPLVYVKASLHYLQHLRQYTWYVYSCKCNINAVEVASIWQIQSMVDWLWRCGACGYRGLTVIFFSFRQEIQPMSGSGHLWPNRWKRRKKEKNSWKQKALSRSITIQ